MNDKILIRGAGFCACLAALLHIPGLGADWVETSKQQLYLVIDVLLTFALFGLFAATARFRSLLGTLGFAGAIIATLVIRTGPRLIGGGEVYTAGAAVFSISLAIASLSLVRERGLVRYAALAWIASLLIGLAAKAAPILMTGAVALFSIGFFIAGVAMTRGRSA